MHRFLAKREKRRRRARREQKKLKCVWGVISPGGGERGTPLQEANRDVPLDGVAFSRLECS